MPTSRARVRGRSTQSANGADAAAAMTAGAGRFRRRRTSGAATPAASAAAAAALMAVDRRTAGGQSNVAAGGREAARQAKATSPGRLGDQRRDDARARVDLGVPLHAEHPARVRHLDRLDEVVEHAPAARHEPVAEPVDGLVVVRLGAVHELAARPRGERSLGEPDVVVGVVERAEPAPVVAVADVVGQVLDQRPAERDVEQLHAAADAEQRQVALDRPARERDLRRVALGPRPGRAVVRLGAVGGRVEVGAAREDQRVEVVEHLVGLRAGARVGRDHQRDPAALLDRVDVRAREQERLALPDRPARVLERRADADDRPRHLARLPGRPGLGCRACPSPSRSRDRRAVARRVQRRRAADRAEPPGPDERLGQAARARPARRGRAGRGRAVDPRRDDHRAPAARSRRAPICAPASTRGPTGGRTSAPPCASATTRSSPGSGGCPSRCWRRSTGRRWGSAARSRSPATSCSRASPPTCCSRS